MTDVSIWSILLLLTKLLSYIAVAAFIGGTLVTYLVTRDKELTTTSINEYRFGIHRWQLRWLVIGIGVALLYLPLQAGSMAEAGWFGMFDNMMLNIAWQSALGTQTVWRLAGLLLALVWLMWTQTKPSHSRYVYLIGLFCGVILAGSFSLSGHPVELGIIAQILLSLHVFAIAAWAGSLWPLYVSCHQVPGHELGVLMHKFGQVAMAIVALLIVCGSILAIMLLGSVGELFTSAYGRLLLLKLLLVASMLMLGAWHKFSLVPELRRGSRPNKLGQSIAIEGILGISVLIITSVFTTLVGPAMH